MHVWDVVVVVSDQIVMRPTTFLLLVLDYKYPKVSSIPVSVVDMVPPSNPWNCLVINLTY